MESHDFEALWLVSGQLWSSTGNFALKLMNWSIIREYLDTWIALREKIIKIKHYDFPFIVRKEDVVHETGEITQNLQNTISL